MTLDLKNYKVAVETFYKNNGRRLQQGSIIRWRLHRERLRCFDPGVGWQGGFLEGISSHDELVVAFHQPGEDEGVQSGGSLCDEAERSCKAESSGIYSGGVGLHPGGDGDGPGHGRDPLVISEAKYDAGIVKILDAWDQMVGRSLNDKKGELREKFYLHTRRNPQVAVMTFALRYRNLMSEMKQEGITIDDAEAAWFYKQKLGLSELQKQMMETTLNWQ